jgi:hypothetical protein
LPQARRIPLSRRSHIIGFQWTPAGATSHESALERDFVTLTSFLTPAGVIQSQPVTIVFEDQGLRRRYTPDFLVTYSGGTDLVEVKYASALEANWDRLAPAFSAAKQWANARNGRFRVASDPRLTSLLPRRRGPTPGGSRLSSEINQLIDEAIESLYLTRQRPRLIDLVVEIRRRCRTIGSDSRHRVVRRCRHRKGAVRQGWERSGGHAGDCVRCFL